MYQAELEGERSVLVNCERCNSVISVQIPVDLIINSKEALLPLSYVHKDKNGRGYHCITFFVDQGYSIRRPYTSDVIIQD